MGMKEKQTRMYYNILIPILVLCSGNTNKNDFCKLVDNLDSAQTIVGRKLSSYIINGLQIIDTTIDDPKTKELLIQLIKKIQLLELGLNKATIIACERQKAISYRIKRILDMLIHKINEVSLTKRMLVMVALIIGAYINQEDIIEYRIQELIDKIDSITDEDIEKLVKRCVEKVFN